MSMSILEEGRIWLTLLWPVHEGELAEQMTWMYNCFVLLGSIQIINNVFRHLASILLPIKRGVDKSDKDHRHTNPGTKSKIVRLPMAYTHTFGVYWAFVRPHTFILAVIIIDSFFSRARWVLEYINNQLSLVICQLKIYEDMACKWVICSFTFKG